MIRPTRTQIDAQIVDLAAGLFARHGFSHTSLQQIADATGYSKAGLLHHFPSKKAIYDEAIAFIHKVAEEIFEAVTQVPMGKDRDRALIEGWIDFTISNPGVSALSNRLAVAPENDELELQEAGRRILAALGMDFDNIQPGFRERIIRVTVAMTGLGVVVAQIGNLTDDLRADVIAATMGAMGHTV